MHIFSFTWNSEKFLQFMIDHYRSMFPDCIITFFDYQSIDNSVEIAKSNNCEVIDHQHGGKLDDLELIKLKNNCWKNGKTDWVLIVDPDELLEINKSQLDFEISKGTTIIKPIAYDIVNLEDNFDFSNMKHGIRNSMYDKCCLFNKSYITDINWVAGAHVANPIGKIIYNTSEYKLFHYRYLNPQFTIERYRSTAARLSEINIKTGMGDYVFKPEEKIIAEYKEKREKAERVIL